MSDFDIVSKDAEIDTRYGLEAFRITIEDIAALLSGKKLYSTVNADEYAITIEMEEEDRLIEHRTKYYEKNAKEGSYECDRNICVSNEYNGIGCDECEVIKNGSIDNYGTYT